MEKTSTILAKIISVVFHPLLMPSYTVFILFNTDTHFVYLPFEIKKIIYTLVFLCTFIIPVCLIPFLINLRIVSGIGLNERKDRHIPLLISSSSYYFAYYLLNRLSLSTISFIEMMILASAVLIFICFLISLKWKISAHLIGIGGMMAGFFFYAASFIANYTYLLIILSLIAGLVGFARLKLNVHTPTQVYVGFALGFIGMLVFLTFGI